MYFYVQKSTEIVPSRSYIEMEKISISIYNNTYGIECIWSYKRQVKGSIYHHWMSKSSRKLVGEIYSRYWVVYFHIQLLVSLTIWNYRLTIWNYRQLTISFKEVLSEGSMGLRISMSEVLESRVVGDDSRFSIMLLFVLWVHSVAFVTAEIAMSRER